MWRVDFTKHQIYETKSMQQVLMKYVLNNLMMLSRLLQND